MPLFIPVPYQPPPSKAIRVEDVYAPGYTVPAGYEAIDFRPPKSGETIIESINGTHWNALIDYSPFDPRIILRKLPTPMRWTIVVEEGTSRDPDLKLSVGGNDFTITREYWNRPGLKVISIKESKGE